MPGVNQRARRRSQLGRCGIRRVSLQRIGGRDGEGVAARDAGEGDEALLFADAFEAGVRGDVAGGERGLDGAVLRVLGRAGELLGAGQVPVAGRILPRAQAGGAVPGDVGESGVQWIR